MSYGQVNGFAAQKVHSFDEEPVVSPRVKVDYIAFPYETYPFHRVGEGTPWSFSVLENQKSVWDTQHPYFEHATVRVTHVSDGASLVLSERYTDTQAIGVANFLSWQVEGWEYDTLYEVEIRNVSIRAEKRGAIRTRCLLTETISNTRPRKKEAWGTGAGLQRGAGGRYTGAQEKKKSPLIFKSGLSLS